MSVAISEKSPTINGDVMGPWGLGTFEDDVACDWLEDLGDSDPIEFFRVCLDLTDQGDLDYAACVGVVCTAEMVLALLREPREGFPDSASSWLRDHADLPVAPFLPQTVSGLYQVMAEQSEMHQLWEDNRERYGQWKRRMHDLIDRLEALS